uniref:Uncharacterized protein n=1 Tax=Plectus sambesii TaxID=2011161 RepID=A0A914VQH6_9BILA
MTASNRNTSEKAAIDAHSSTLFVPGTITLNRALLTNPSTLQLYWDYTVVTVAKMRSADVIQTQYCLDGWTKYPLVPNGTCSQQLCDPVYTYTIYDALSAKGVANFPEDLLEPFQDKFDLSDLFFLASLFKGLYSAQVQLSHAHMTSRNVIGCIEDTNFFINVED